MTIALSPERNVESIRRRNVQENQVFLENLRMINIRNDFVSSARSILRRNTNNQPVKKLNGEQKKAEYATRYREKVKSGTIGPYISERQRRIEAKKQESEARERRKLAMQKKRQEAEARRQERLIESERKKLEIQQKQQEVEARREERLFNRELRQVERRLQREERAKLIRARRLPPRWTLFYRNSTNGNPYQRTFKPRATKVGQRAEHKLF